MASGTLFTYPNNFRAYKALIAAEYSGAKVKVDPNFKFGETNASKAFLAKFPLGKVPAFESSSGDCISESNALHTMLAMLSCLAPTRLMQPGYSSGSALGT